MQQNNIFSLFTKCQCCIQYYWKCCCFVEVQLTTISVWQASVFLIKKYISQKDLHLIHWKWVSKFENVNVTLQKLHTKNSHHFTQQNIKNLTVYY